MRYLILILLLYSCSAKWHYNKAIKKGLEITTKSDTIRITTIDSIPVIRDSVIVYEKYFSSKDTVIFYKDVYIPKTIREIRVENKLIRDTIRIKENANVRIAKEETKQTRAENNVFSKFIIGLVIGFIVAVVIWFVMKIKK
jgi:PBP1b-binding outer membrane lipoprotein LpoB